MRRKITRWLVRQSLDFADTKFAKAHAAKIEKHVPAVEKKLKDARRDWEATFCEHAQLPAAKTDTDIPLTDADVENIRRAMKYLNGDPFSAALYSDLEMLLEAGYANAKTVLHIETDLKDVKPTFAMEQLRKQIDEFAFMVNGREQTVLNDTLDTALSEGWTPKKLAATIATTFSEGYHILDDAGKITRTIPTDSWSEMVARTELNRAQTMGQMALYTAAGVEKVMWVATGGADMCPECAAADGEVVEMGDAFSVGVDSPPLHPRCNCSLMAADADILGDEEEAA